MALVSTHCIKSRHSLKPDRRTFVALQHDIEAPQRREVFVIQLVEFMTPVFALGFMAGYGMRSLISHHRRMRSTR